MSAGPALLEVLRAAQLRSFLGSVPIESHVENGNAFIRVLHDLGVDEPSDARIVDLGSGGGVPSLLIAAELHHVKLRLVERSTNRAQFLEHAVKTLGLADRVEVLTANAEEAARWPELEGWADVVTARSFAPPPVTAECACRFLRPAGVLVVSEPPNSPARWPADELAPTGLVPTHSVRDRASSFQVLTRPGPVREDLPRRAAVTRRRPLF